MGTRSPLIGERFGNGEGSEAFEIYRFDEAAVRLALDLRQERATGWDTQRLVVSGPLHEVW